MFFGENINYSISEKIFLTGAPKRIKLPSTVLFVYPFHPILTKYKTNLEVTFCLLHKREWIVLIYRWRPHIYY
jgi:hypothetical protein